MDIHNLTGPVERDFVGFILHVDSNPEINECHSLAYMNMKMTIAIDMTMTLNIKQLYFLKN